MRNFEPGTWLTEPIAREIRAAARAAVAYRNRWPDSEDYSRRSMSHLFSPHDREADAFIAELVTAGAMLPPGECWGGEVFVREPVFQVIMTVLALGARAVLYELDLHLAAKPGQYADGFTLAAALEALGAPRRKLAIPDDQLGVRSPLRHGPGTGFIALQFTSDMQDVGVDLTGVPLEEVLDFRRQHGVQYRAYRRALRKYATAFAAVPPKERELLACERTEEIRDLASALRTARRSIARPLVGFGMAVAGAAWTLRSTTQSARSWQGYRRPEAWLSRNGPDRRLHTCSLRMTSADDHDCGLSLGFQCRHKAG